jgi:KDO2-lipid IV(A) lauroyltransferase
MAPKNTAEGEITRAYAHKLEQSIIDQPELWLWSHNRFKWQKQA